MTFGERIKNARKRLGLTQAALAEKLGVSTEAVSKWERGGYSPEPDKLEALHRRLGLSYLDPEDERAGSFFDEVHMSAYLKGRFNSGAFPQAAEALRFAKDKHAASEPRKPAELKIPYINHPLTLACQALALGIEDDTVLAAALLHDVCEDCGVAPEELPVGPEAREVVRLVTKPQPLLSERKYYEAIAENHKACMVKCLDRCNNLSGMSAGFSAERIRDYVEETETYYPELLKVLKETPEYNNAAWLLSYQIWGLVEMAKRIR